MVNLKLARRRSRKLFLDRIKTAYYQRNIKLVELHLTFTNNNIFVNFSNGVGNSLWLRTFGMIGYNGRKRKTRYALYYYGLEAGEQLFVFLKNWKENHQEYSKKDVVEIPIKLILHSVFSDTIDLRYKRFMEGLRKYPFYFYKLQFGYQVPYNGCRVAKKRRSRRNRFFR